MRALPPRVKGTAGGGSCGVGGEMVKNWWR